MESLLRWSIENSVPGAPTGTKLNSEALAQLFGAADDATLMKEAVSVITDPSVSLESKQVAFDNLEMLCESLDNANNLDNLSLWPPLLSQLSSPHPKLRFMCAWVCGTAVQNNARTQQKFHEYGGVAKAVDLLLNDDSEMVRKKIVYTISSSIRNYEPALRTVVEMLPERIKQGAEQEGAKEVETYRAEDMEALDRLVGRLREEAVRVR